jgi:hypothetical protein
LGGVESGGAARPPLWVTGATRLARQYDDALPTPRTMLRSHAPVTPACWCSDLQAIVEAGSGDVPLTELRFRCSQCGTDRTYFVVTSRDNPQPW